MAKWSRNELRRIEAVEELELASLRRDGPLANPVTIWVVRVGDDLYVRSWKGHDGAWFRATQVRHEGHIKAGDVDRDVTVLREADGDINDQIDTAYRASTAATAAATLTPWWPLGREPRRSSWCRATGGSAEHEHLIDGWCSLVHHGVIWLHGQTREIRSAKRVDSDRDRQARAHAGQGPEDERQSCARRSDRSRPRVQGRREGAILCAREATHGIPGRC